MTFFGITLALSLTVAASCIAATWSVAWPLGLVFAFVFAVSLQFHFNKIRKDIFHPSFWLSAAYAVYFGIGGYWLLEGDPRRYLSDFLILLMGFGSLQLGLLVKESQSDLKSAQVGQWRKERVLPIMVLWFLAALVSGIFYLVASGHVAWFSAQPETARVTLAESGGAPLRVVLYTLIPWSMLAWADRVTGKALPSWMAWSGTLTAAILFLFTANRAPLIILFCVILLTVFGLSKRERSSTFRTGAVMSILLLAALIVFSAWGAARIAMDEKLSRYPESQYYLDDGNYAGLAARQLVHYLGIGARNFSVVTEAVPDRYGYRLGTSYFDPLLTLLPGRQFTLDMQLKRALGWTFSGGGLVPSMPGEAYANFGIWGVLILPFVIGRIMIKLYTSWMHRATLGFALVYFFLLYYLSVHMVSGILASSITPLLVTGFLVGSHLIFRRSLSAG